MGPQLEAEKEAAEEDDDDDEESEPLSVTSDAIPEGRDEL